MNWWQSLLLAICVLITFDYLDKIKESLKTIAKNTAPSSDCDGYYDENDDNDN